MQFIIELLSPPCCHVPLELQAKLSQVLDVNPLNSNTFDSINNS